jgi:hypothetical protein
MRTFGGIAEMAGGAAYAVGTGSLGAFAGGGVLGLNGFDNAQAGLRSLWTRTYQPAWLENKLSEVTGNTAAGNLLYGASQLGLPFAASTVASAEFSAFSRAGARSGAPFTLSNRFASETGSTINPFAELFGEGPEVSAIHPTTPYRGGFARPPRHHIFPQAERAWFAERGIDIDKYTIQIAEARHQALHGGGNWKLGKMSPDEWNGRLMRDLQFAETRKGGFLDIDEILALGKKQLEDLGLRGVEIVPFR